MSLADEHDEHELQLIATWQLRSYEAPQRVRLMLECSCGQQWRYMTLESALVERLRRQRDD